MFPNDEWIRSLTSSLHTVQAVVLSQKSKLIGPCVYTTLTILNIQITLWLLNKKAGVIAGFTRLNCKHLYRRALRADLQSKRQLINLLQHSHLKWEELMRPTQYSLPLLFAFQPLPLHSPQGLSLKHARRC